MGDFDIKTVLDEIKEEALRRIPENENLPSLIDLLDLSSDSVFEVFNKAEYDHDLYRINQNWSIPATPDIPCHGGAILLIKCFFKRVIRKMIFWYVRPIIDKGNEYTARNVNLHNQTSRFIMMTDAEHRKLQARVLDLQERIDRLEAERPGGNRPT